MIKETRIYWQCLCLWSYIWLLAVG